MKRITLLIIIILSVFAGFGQMKEFDCQNCSGNILRDYGLQNVAADYPSGIINKRSRDWKQNYGKPKWLKQKGCCDNGIISMTGNKLSGESVRQNGLQIVAGKKYSIRFCARYVKGNTKTPYVRFRFRAFNGNGVNPATYTSNANLIGISQPITNNNWITYTIADWVAPQNFTAIDINVENNSASLLPNQMSTGQIDNLCITEVKSDSSCTVLEKEAYLTINNRDQTKLICGSKMEWPCEKEFSFNINYPCKPNNCLSTINYQVVLNDSIIKKGVGLSAIKDAFTPSKNGNYTITFNALCGKNKSKTCTVDVVVTNCKPQTEGSCCAYSLHFINKPGNINAYSKVKITALNGSQIINSDPDNWYETRNYPTSVSWSPPVVNSFPFGETIENDFMIYLSNFPVNQTLKVEWLDAGNVVKATYEITIPCGKKFEEDEDWTKYVTAVSGNDPNIGVFAVQEPDEDDCGEELQLFKTTAPCPFTTSMQCVGNTYTVSVNGPVGFVNYDWTIDGQLNGNHGSSFSFPLSGSGEHKIEMVAIDGNGDQCMYQEGIIIPDISPEIKAEKDKCSLQYTFSAQGYDSSDVSSISWQCSGVSGFPVTGQGTNQAVYTFAAEGTYTVTVTLVDVYGCSVTKSQSFDINNRCAPSFGQSFKFCPSDCNKSGMAKIMVRFDNTSTGGFCPVKYTWDFGDGTPLVVSGGTVEHAYTVDCKEGKTFDVTLTMEDSNPDATKKCKETTKKSVAVKPCKFDFTYVACPDGRVNFTEINGKYGKWSFPGSHSKAPWPYSGAKKIINKNTGLQNSVVVRYDASGDYTVTFKGYEEGGCECEITKTIHVELDCCRKNQASRDNHQFGANGKNYKIKYKLAARQYPFYHRINATTKLKVQKKIKSTSIKYWRNTLADNITASINGKLYETDDVTKCNCKKSKDVTENVARSNKSKAKCNHNEHNTKFRLRLGTTATDRIQSTHSVTVGGTAVSYNLELPNNNCLKNVFDSSEDCCTPFRWYFDWF